MSIQHKRTWITDSGPEMEKGINTMDTRLMWAKRSLLFFYRVAHTSTRSK